MKDKQIFMKEKTFLIVMCPNNDKKESEFVSGFVSVVVKFLWEQVKITLSSFRNSAGCNITVDWDD